MTRTHVAKWTDDIVRALQNLGGSGHLDEISKEVAKIRSNLPASFRAIIRREIQEHCSETQSFKREEDLFYSVEGLGQGVWALRSFIQNDLTENANSKAPNVADTNKVYIANFGEGNAHWSRVKANNSVATFSDIRLYKLWSNGARAEFLDLACSSVLTAKGKRPVRSVAERWFNLISELDDTENDLWISKQGDHLFWAVSLHGELKETIIPSPNPSRAGDKVYSLEKPCTPWSDTDLVGRPLRWSDLHPKSRDFLATEAAFQKITNNRGYADFAKALVLGGQLSQWTESPLFKHKKPQDHSAVHSFSSKERMAWRVADTMQKTVASADGRIVQRSGKLKNTNLSREQCQSLVIEMFESQEGICAYSGLQMQLDGEEEDKEMLVSLDRIDSDDHYSPENLHLVCRFINRWKSNDSHERFERLISKLRD